MISTLGTVHKPSFLTLIASISPHKSFQRHTRLWPSRPPAYQISHYQTRPHQFISKSDQVSRSCSQQVRLFQRPERQCRPRAVIFCYRSSSSNASKAPNKQQRDNLPSQDEGQRSHLSKKFSHLMDNVQSNIFFAGQRLNDLTGYSGIEALKRDIQEQGQACFIYLSTEKFLSDILNQRGIFKLPALRSSKPEKPTQLRYLNDPTLSAKSMSCSSANMHGPPMISSASQPSIGLIMQTNRRNLWPKSS